MFDDLEWSLNASRGCVSISWASCYAPTLIGGGIKRRFCLSSVWRLSVAYIGPKSRTERPRKTEIGTEAAQVTRDSDTTFKIKGSKVTRPLCSPPCWRVRRLQRWAWERVGRTSETAATLPSARRRKALRRPRGRRGAGAYRGGRPPTARYRSNVLRPRWMITLLGLIDLDVWTYE